MSQRASAKGGTLLYDAVYVVAKDVLAKETGRKAMVILSDGGDLGSRRTIAEAIEQARARGCPRCTPSFTACGRVLAVATPVVHRRPILAWELLEKLSESTGGQKCSFTVSRTMGLREIFAQIADDLRLQYELGYKPPPDTQPNSYHKLELKAKDKKLTVQARKGFFEPP